MNTYLIVKTLHIISATLMVGTGFGTAFYLFWANRSGSVAAQSVVSHWVIKADWWFTTPAVIFQPLSGLWMLYERGYTVSTMLEQTWVWMTLGLYILAGICWLPVVWLQIRMAKIAEQAHKENADTIPEPYWRYARRWELLGYPAFCATIVIYFLMVMKPI
jgi:integral membrane protein